jgi:hypothetical protein
LIVETALAPQYEGGSTFADVHDFLVRECGFSLYGFTTPHRDATGAVLWTDSVYFRSGRRDSGAPAAAPGSSSAPHPTTAPHE